MTHWLDMSQTYGTNARTSAKLRLFKGGLLRFSTVPGSRFEQLPVRPNFEECRRSGVRTCKFFQAGDPRAEDNNFLTSMHTIWLREHNRVARELAYLNPRWDDETLFQEAKRIVIAEYQHIVYAEYLPVILGEKIARLYGLLPLERGYFYKYENGLYPQIANEFSFAMRFCHTLVPFELHLANSNYVKLPPKTTGYFLFQSNLTLQFNDMPIRASIRDWAYYPSPQVNHDLNNQLFEGLFPDSKRFSLPTINIQRSRDHGVPGYNYYRELCGLNYANTFEEFFNVPPYVIARLKSVYAHPNDVDIWTGLVSEYPVEGGTFGATASCIYIDIFNRLLSLCINCLYFKALLPSNSVTWSSAIDSTTRTATTKSPDSRSISSVRSRLLRCRESFATISTSTSSNSGLSWSPTRTTTSSSTASKSLVSTWLHGRTTALPKLILFYFITSLFFFAFINQQKKYL